MCLYFIIKKGILCTQHLFLYIFFFLPNCIYLASILNEGNLAVVLVHDKTDTQFKGDMFLAECFSYTQYVFHLREIYI